MPGRQQDDGRDEERNADRHDRDDECEPARLFETPFDPHQLVPSPPAIRRPSSSTVAVLASRSPTTEPSYMTTIRSASTKISSRSSLSSSTPTPPAAASRKYACTVSIAATSSPRVGDAATTTDGLPENSRARTTFWRFPPES